MVALLMVSIPLACRLVTLGSDIGLSIRIWKRSRVDQRADLNAVLVWTAVVVMVFLGLALVVDTLAGRILGPVLVGGILLTAGFRSCTQIFQVMLRREERVLQVGFIVTCRALLVGIACTSTVLFVDATASAYLVGMVIAEGLAAVWALGRLHHLYDLHPFERGSIARVRELVRIGFPSIPGMAATLLLAAGDRFVISALLGLTAVGVYALGQRLAEYVVQILFVPFTTAFSPFVHRIASEDQARAIALIRETALKFAYLGGVVVGFPVIFGREVIHGFAGLEYAPAATVFLLIVAAVLVCQVSQILATYFTQTEQLRKYMWIIIVAASGNIALNVVAVQVAGIIGAAVVSLVMYEIVLVASLVGARRASVKLASFRQLHVPIVLFGVYLGLVYSIDVQNLAPAVSVPIKTTLWATYVGLCVAISQDARSVILGAVDRVRLFLTS